MLISCVGRLFFGATIPLFINALYVDNLDPGRRVPSIKDTEQFKMIEQALLKSLGLSSRPRPKPGLKVPQHMKDLYHSHTDDPDWISTNFRFGGKWTAANTVRSYHHEDNQVEKFPGRQDNVMVLIFNISTLPRNENVTTAELRIYRRNDTKASAFTRRKKIYRVSIYQVLKPAATNRPVRRRLLDSRHVDVATSGWETFDVLSAVRHWAKMPKENYGLEVHTLVEEGQYKLQSVPVVVLSQKQEMTLSNDEWQEQRPLLVAYTHDGKEHKQRRQKRSAISTPKKKKKVDYCHRRPLYVDFQDVSWDDWIIAPPGYSAFYCQGNCPFPLDNHLNSTNHAIVQTLVHNVNPRAVPSVCCVPTALEPIQMLYMDDNEAVLRNYPSMVVVGCGCR